MTGQFNAFGYALLGALAVLALVVVSALVAALRAQARGGEDDSPSTGLRPVLVGTLVAVLALIGVGVVLAFLP